MKKKKIIILISVIIAILLVLGTIFVIYNKNKNKFKLNSDRYIVNKINVSDTVIMTNVAVTTTKESYYEIDLQSKKVELREDFIDYENDKNNYSRKLITAKYLSQEESDNLKGFLNKVIKENKKQNTEKYNGADVNSPVIQLSHYYYSVKTKDIENIIFDTAENIQEFEKIVKMDN